MNFEKFLTEKVYELRNDLNNLTDKYSELKPHFGLSHNGLLDTETERLVESSAFFMTLTHAKMQSTIANQIKNFMEPVFPDLYLPEIPTYIVEFNNYEEYYDIEAKLKTSNYMTCNFNYNEKEHYLSILGNKSLCPYAISNSYFTAGSRNCDLNLVFDLMVDIESDAVSKKYKLYFNHDNINLMLDLFAYILFHNHLDRPIIYEDANNTFKMDRSILSLSLENEKIKNVFYDNNNKLDKIKDVLNNMKNYLFLEIDFSQYFEQISESFTIKIPLSSDCYNVYSQVKNIVKTNCFVFHNVYKKDLPWIFVSNSSDNEIEICDLKNNSVLSLSEISFFDNEKECIYTPTDDIYVNKRINFDFEIPMNITQFLKIDKEKLKSEVRVQVKAICTSFIKNYLELVGKEIFIADQVSSAFGTILNSNSNHIFYPEVLSDPTFLNYHYNTNFFIGKRINTFLTLKDYYNSISHLFFNNKEFFLNYIDEIKISNYLFSVDVLEQNFRYVIQYNLGKINKKIRDHIYAKILEKLLESITDRDVRYKVKQ